MLDRVSERSWRTIWSAIAILVLTGSVAASAAGGDATGNQAPQTLQQSEDRQQIDKMLSALDEMKTIANKKFSEDRDECLKAFGHSGFCNCLADKLPIGVGFRSYVSIVAGTREEVSYDKLSAHDKELFNLARNARDVCVSTAFGSRKLGGMSEEKKGER